LKHIAAMRLLLLSALTLTACSNEPVARPPAVLAGSFVGVGRNALCIAGEGRAQRAGVIVYGEGDLNCSASGKIDATGSMLVLIPSGETECRIPLNVAGETVTIGAVPAACAYYCVPGARLEGQAFRRSSEARPVTDFAGDPLC
jgi:hypothetical protein